MSLQNIIEKTREYLQVPSVVGYEHNFMKHLEKDFSKEGYEVQRHEHVVTVSKTDSINPKILTAHIDRHGMVINSKGIFEPAFFEYAAFYMKKLLGMEIKASENKLKKTGERFVNEIVYHYGDYFRPKDDEGRVTGYIYDKKKKNLLFEIDGMWKLKFIISSGWPIITPIAFKSELEVKEGKISSQLDNAISVAVAYQLVQDGFDGRVILAAEEEIGRSWEYIVDYLKNNNIESKEIITLDTTPYNDEHAITQGLVILRNKDQYGVFNPKLVEKLRDSCEKQGIKYEMKDEFIEAKNAELPEGKKPQGLGKTELGNIVKETKGCFNGATIQLPTINYHTNHETTSELALNNYYEALKKIL
ncbi:hypothetical protein KY348_01910 [Candidatus Woesearchaeota archaeon]|nr:hypothetical protein [Candidatus Woesearchaeota archaeon]